MPQFSCVVLVFPFFQRIFYIHMKCDAFYLYPRQRQQNKIKLTNSKYKYVVYNIQVLYVPIYRFNFASHLP